MAIPTDERIWSDVFKAKRSYDSQAAGQCQVEETRLGSGASIAPAGTAEGITLTSILCFMTTHSMPNLAIHSSDA